MRRERLCNNPAPAFGGHTCSEGRNHEVQTCNPGPCVFQKGQLVRGRLGEWGQWSRCSRSCSGGTGQRVRPCHGYGDARATCDAPLVEVGTK